jgi:hypothetical protein
MPFRADAIVCWEMAAPHRFLFEVVEPVRKIFLLALRGTGDAG